MGFALAHGIEIGIDLIAATQIERDHGVYVGQTYGRVFLVDLSGVAPSRKAAINVRSVT